MDAKRGAPKLLVMPSPWSTRERVGVWVSGPLPDYANALVQKENLDPGGFRQARLHPLPNPLP